MLPKGTTVAGYRIDGALGEGGMGTVYRATQLSLNRSVALKILSADLGDDESFRERFRREGLLQAAIDHPHIVTVYDTGETEHGLFLAMRMVRGPTLKDMVLGRELDPARALRLLAQVAEALDTAHDVGLTHRDIKPQNILIGARDHAYLADFGLTKAPDEAGRLTATGQFVGTIDYVSPEQVQGEPATARSDVYALTGVLYECLVGAVPYPKPTEAAVVYAHISEPPPRPTAARPELPEAIDAVIAKGMGKDPDERYGSAGELLAAAGEALGEAVGEPPGPISAPEDAGVRAARARDGAPAGPTLPASPDQLGADVTAASPVHAPPTKPPAPPTAAAAPATAPAGVGEDRSAPAKAGRSRATPALVAMTVLGVVLAAAAGFALGGSDSDSEPGASRLTNSASAGSLGLSFPSGWRRVAEEPRIAGMSFSQPIVLSAAEFPGARLVAGQVDGEGPTMLPEDFVASLSGELPRAEAVDLGGLQAFRYPELAPEGSRARMRVYATPTSERVAVVACMAEPTALREFAAECEEVAETLELTGTKALPLGPREEYAKEAGAALRRLDTAVTAGRRRLRAARTPAGQARAATALAAAYRRAARSLAAAPAGPLERGTAERLERSLRRIGAAYARAARAARRGDRSAYRAAGRSVRRTGSGVRAALAGFEALGYTVR